MFFAFAVGKKDELLSWLRGGMCRNYAIIAKLKEE